MADDRFRWARPPRKQVRRSQHRELYEARAAVIAQLRFVVEMLNEKLAEEGVAIEPLAPEPARPSNDRFRWRQGRTRVEVYPAPSVMLARILALKAQFRDRLALLDQHGIKLGLAESEAVNLVLPPAEARRD